jgi:serine/threonine protein kinase
MCAVYRAMDTRLGREVAIKVSAERFTERFERESRAVAALNHPNICTLHDVGPNYLVMELVEGITLEERMKEGALSMEEALAIARQIVSALEAAHDKGIVHRDLKPANIKIKPDGDWSKDGRFVIYHTARAPRDLLDPAPCRRSQTGCLPANCG